MKISTPIFITKCDTIMCNKKAKSRLETNSFKGDSYLCETCFKNLFNSMKRIKDKYETEK